MPALALRLYGRTGNQLFQYAFARKWCERHSFDLLVDMWDGRRVFENTHQAGDIGNRAWQRFNEDTITDKAGDFEFQSYCQQQKCLIYTQSEARYWFELRSNISQAMASLVPAEDEVLCHYRRGDYAGNGVFSIPSQDCMRREAQRWGYDPAKVVIVSDDQPRRVSGLMDWVPDFFRMMSAKVLFRTNSTFSWWAGSLGRGTVYSPNIEAAPGGVEVDVKYELGNHCRCACLPFLTDLYLSP